MTLIRIKGRIRLQCETNRLIKCLTNVLMKVWFRMYWQVFNRTIMNFTDFTKFKLVKQWVDVSALEK